MFAIGEHHRPDFLISSPAVALAAIAARTERIRLSSAVTVLSSDDPVRVFQQFAELDLISGGRAEIMAGRGSFIESFPLFGYDLDDYDELYAEKLDLLLAIRDSERVTWSGRLRAPLDDAGVYPRPVQDPLPVWVAVGGTPQSVVRAGVLGLPLTLAIIGGQPERFAPLVDLYRQAAAEARPRRRGAAAGDQHPRLRRRDLAGRPTRAFAQPYLAMMNRIGRERGWPPSGASRVRGAALAARRRRRRLARAGGREDPVRARAVRQHRYVGQMSVGRGRPRGRDALDRAVRDRGGAGGARARSPRRRAGSRPCDARVERERRARRRVPGVGPARRGQRRRAQPLALGGIGQQRRERAAERVGVAGRHQPGRAGRRRPPGSRRRR